MKDYADLVGVCVCVCVGGGGGGGCSLLDLHNHLYHTQPHRVIDNDHR